MTLSRQLILRVASIALAIGIATSLALVAFAHRDIARESRVVESIDALHRLVHDLEHAPLDDATLARVRALNDSGELKHFHVQLLDETGAGLTPTLELPQSGLEHGLLTLFARDAAPEKRTIVVERPRQSPLLIQISANPLAEAKESFEQGALTVGALLTLCLLLTAAIAWTLHRAFEPVHAIVRHLRQLGEGSPHAPLPALDNPELNLIAASINDMQAALHRQLTKQRELLSRLQDLQESERRQLACELHDEFGQLLTAIQVDAAYLHQRTRDSGPLQTSSKALLDNCQLILRHLRMLLNQLRPQGLEASENQAVALKQAVQDLVHSWRSRTHGQVRWTSDVTLQTSTLPERVSVAAYRIVQEALTNCMRYAHASAVFVRLQSDHAFLQIEVSDDGVGTGPEQPLLRSIDERVSANQGHLQVMPNVPSGTRLVIQLPLPQTTARWQPYPLNAEHAHESAHH